MRDNSLDFWKSKSVLVTGAAGFIGSHLTEKLVQSGARVRAFIRYNSMNSYGLIEVIPEDTRRKIEICTGDILDGSSIRVAMEGIEVVFHMAALPSIPYSFRNPRHVFMVNTEGTTNVLLAAKAAGAQRIILASSAGASEQRPLASPYVTSKAAMERIGMGFFQGLNASVTTVRLFNNYGPRQSARAVIPTIISQALVKDDVHLGATEPKMDFNYVDDSLRAFLHAAMREDTAGEILTWGTGIFTSIGDVAALVFSLIGRTGLHIVRDEKRVRPYSKKFSTLEDEVLRTRDLLKIAPQVNLREGLQKTIDWISGNAGFYKTDLYAI
ncbi:MAG: SDR family NAD(P)-dependent oxidoreductase [candidate division WOR-3 bacterium]|nr:MAG: SDR family NAD(P)-dependent oxidoreductase [candidate division WOR-3 bacterium]